MTAITERLSTALAGRYRLERHLGEGGMATVYLAHDLKHDRRVALKILRPELAAILGAERFLNEIKVTANLQHPNILPLYDSGEADSFLYYVMPHVEGESLRQKMGREKQLGVEETVELAKAVAGALQYAHEQGIVHRDIKPENILLQRGQPLVADFGIALAVSQAGGTRLTETGLSLGTPHYMSPEQATGDRELDARSDVYSLGAMVYEMLTGEPPHHGATVQAIIARILSAEPEPIARHRPSVPAHVDAAVRKALDKTPADRFSSAEKFAVALGNPAFTSGSLTATRAGPAVPMSRRPSAALIFAATTLLATGLAAWGWLRGRPESGHPVIRYTIEERVLDQARDYGTNFALSPDGEVLVWAGYGDAGDRFGLWVRRRNQLESTPLPGGEQAHQPFFSPDGRHVGFVTFDRALRVASLEGEPTVTLLDSGIVRGGGSWGTDGYIYLTGGAIGIESGEFTGIVRVPAAGGNLEVVTRFDTAQGDVNHSFPEALPGGRGVVFTLSRNRLYVAADEEIAVVDLSTGVHRSLLPGVQARWSPTGHLLVVQADGKLVAAPFDPERLELTGTAVPLLEGVAVDALGSADLALSAGGRLVYAAGGVAETGAALLPVWMDRTGHIATIDSAWSGVFLNPAVSPDGSMIAVQVGVPPTADLWVKRLPRGPFSRLTFAGQFSGSPSWSPDGRSVVFLSDRESPTGHTRAFVKRADGSDEASPILDVEVSEIAYSRDGRWLVYSTNPRADKPGIYARRTDGDTSPVLLVPRRNLEGQFTLSPNGRWLAYRSLESGRSEVYVRPFPDASSARWQVSVEGGASPRWRADSRELYYLTPRTEAASSVTAGNWDLVAVAVEPGSVFAAGDRRVVATLGDEIVLNGWDVASDGRYVFIRAGGTSGSDATRTLVVVEDFLEELNAKVGR